MNLDDVTAFLQIVSNNSLSRAAKAMRRPKASVSHQIHRLESELGAPLFLRTTNQLILNDAGRDFLSHAEEIRRACERGVDAARRGAEVAANRLSVAASSEFSSNLMMPIMTHFMRKFPSVNLDVMVFQRDMLFDIREQYDCILHLGDPPLPQFSNMSARLLGRFTFGLYASPGYLSGREPIAAPKDLLSNDLLGFFDGQSVTKWDLLRGRDTFSVQPETRLLGNDYWVVKLSAIHDYGICFVPDFFAGQEQRSGLLQRVLPDWSSGGVPVYALYWSHRFKNPHIRALITTISDNFEEVYSYLYTAERKETLRSKR